MIHFSAGLCKELVGFIFVFLFFWVFLKFVKDLPESLLNEWLMQIQIQTKVSNSLRQQHEEYEDKLRQIDEALAARKAHEKNKGGDGDKKKKPPVIPKAPKEPQVLPPDMYPEVYDEFLVEEQKQYENFINVVFHPDSLKLTPGEVRVDNDPENI